MTYSEDEIYKMIGGFTRDIKKFTVDGDFESVFILYHDLGKVLQNIKKENQK